MKHPSSDHLPGPSCPNPFLYSLMLTFTTAFTCPRTTRCSRTGPPTQYILLGLSSLQQPLEILLFCSLGEKEDFDITTTTLYLSYITSVCVGAFLTAQRTLLTLRHPRRAFIKFLRLHVPYVPRCDVDPMAEDFIGTRARLFLLGTLFLIQILSKHFIHLSLALIH